MQSQEGPSSLAEITLEVKQSTVEEGSTVPGFSSKSTIILLLALLSFALSVIFGLSVPLVPWGLGFMAFGLFMAYLIASYANWIGFKPPNYVEDLFEDYARAGQGGSRFVFGRYRHPKPGTGEKLHKLLEEAR